MSGLRLFMMILMASRFAFSGLARAAPAAGSAAPCHEMPMPTSGQHDSKAMLSASCCIGCMPAGQLYSPPVAVSHIVDRPAYEIALGGLDGRALSPDLPPPRA